MECSKQICQILWPNVPFKTSAERDQYIKQVLIQKMIPFLEDNITITESTYKDKETGTFYSCHRGYLKIIDNICSGN